jgi:hypothetical protein
MDTVREKHKCLINGLTRLFALFIKAHYIAPTDVLYPPQDVDVGRLQRLGFDAEVIDLVRVLPAIKNEAVWGYNDEGIEMIPRGWADHTDKDAKGVFPPSIIRLTFPGFYGVNVLYDVHDRTSFSP